MTAYTVECPIDGCNYRTRELPEAVILQLLKTHAVTHESQQSVQNAVQVSGPKLERPKIEMGISLEEWNLFERRWNVFQAGSRIEPTLAAPQLFQCASTALGDALLKVDPVVTQKPLADLMNSMRELAVIPVAIGVVRSELLEFKQRREEPFRAFTAHNLTAC